ncbi:MAG: hypothetical protein KC547_11380 [Anaerolineae bacterium]|nr:hypothetical protein [Anaerolineae bacterium]
MMAKVAPTAMMNNGAFCSNIVPRLASVKKRGFNAANRIISTKSAPSKP